MAEETKNITISKNNSGFPGYLDFDTLRSEGIDYLGKLTGKIWTDYNVHDPGITILEVLCYALLDLGYRTNLPVADILARDPKDVAADNNFFTAAQMLTCNPLTIIDFRKLLIDIAGVKNAWLEVATDQQDFCRRPQPEPQPNPQPGNTILSAGYSRTEGPPCIDYLNGLYHVYIDLETDVEKQFGDDTVAKQTYFDSITAKVKQALMAHRNLCEDFIDIHILCKQEIGVCAEIDLETNADVEQVYISIVEKLRSFFSPAPQFYTLQQLLEKETPIDTIFAGRPYDISESHGFTDAEELEQLTLRKEIHLSDVYHAILDVPGVKGVNGLQLQSCDNNAATPINGWKYQLPENHVPEVSWECSGFRFTKNGQPVFIDFKKYEGLFSIRFSHNGKIAYEASSPFVDSAVPEGAYRSDLADYYSIQNEFPRVYGIADGGLSENASAERKAQAYQLRAWLLFFDQLLANYLAQLKNIRNLFSLSLPGKGDSHTYFISQLTNVPELQKLIRFNAGENDSSILGTEGSILVFPVEKKKLTEQSASDTLNTLNLEDIEPYTFHSLAAQQTAIDQLKNDLYYQQYQIACITKNDACVFYYLFTSSDEIALVCKKYFKDTATAKQHADSLPYIGSFDENYNSFITSSDSFSFNISLNLLSFSKYLQLIAEEPSLFQKRRQAFLNHLLSRFAEQFTDFALLSFGFQNPQQLPLSEIEQKEKFLTHYDSLSSNRGRAYNYLEHDWNTQNISGFEKKIMAISGMDDTDRRSLCSFMVAKYDEQFSVSLNMAGTVYFIAEENSDSVGDGLAAAQAQFLAMKEMKNFSTEYVVHDKDYILQLNYGTNQKAFFPHPFNTEQEALDTAQRLTDLFIKKDAASTVFASSFTYIPELKGANGKVARRSVANYDSEDEAKKNVLKTIRKIDDRKHWQYDEQGAALGNLYHIPAVTDHLSFINITAFKIDIDNSVIDKPDVFTYELLDKGNTFKFISSNEFLNEEDAGKDAHALLALLTNEFSYEIFPKEDNRFGIQIRDQQGIVAVCANDAGSEEEALKLKYRILGIVLKHRYDVEIDKEANRWKFNYELGYDTNNIHHFESVLDYSEQQEAIQAAAAFIETEPELKLNEGKEGLTLTTARNKNTKPITVLWKSYTGSEPDLNKREVVEKLLEEKKELSRLNKSNTTKDFRESVRLDDKSSEGLYVYRLVDKDHATAGFTKQFFNEEEGKSALKALSKKFRQPAGFLQICLGGGHIIHKRKDQKKNKYWYHYQVKSLNHFYNSGDDAGKSLILFESIKGYASEEAAEVAFKEDYLLILHWASVAANYGVNKKISLEEIIIHDADSWNQDESIVFVPKATVDDLGGDPDIVKQKLVIISLAYPIRIVAFKSEEFYKQFPCEKEKAEDTGTCKKEKEKFVYYFFLQSGEEEGWQSTKYFKSSDEAAKAFSFFLMLLKYSGNYFVDCDRCTKSDNNIYRIYVREVLAEGTERFPTEERAWSSEGLQQFICIAQSQDAFHTYIRSRDCCFAFYVSCRDSIIYHPCKYDTPQRRDTAMLQLYQLLRETIQKKSWQIDDTGNGLLLLDGSGDSFAKMEMTADSYCLSDLVWLMSESSEDNNNFRVADGRYILVGKDNNRLAVATKQDLTLEEWATLLKTFVCMYPVTKTRGGSTRNAAYCIEIKLPGFNNCKEDIAAEKPCGCGNKQEEENHDCHVAWKSRCCYDNCQEAEQALQTFIRMLLQYEFYQPVFDCACHSFGIALRFEKIPVISNQRISYYDSESRLTNWHNSEIVAINPQCYASKEEACEAVNRAKKLINAEGLHVVEHILLRPHCKDDCNCRQFERPCAETGCSFEWKLPVNPCEDTGNICFEPGTDPYSFVATIVLPAWPERFRKKENRKLLEMIIHREAPAHILVRILWLAPHDFCCFESKYKKWNRWLALKKTCMDDFSVCDFLEFLFNRNYECLGECDVCEPCREQSNDWQPCFAENKDPGNENEYLNQINSMYCWQQQYCGEYQYTDCNRQHRIPGNKEPGTTVIERETERDTRTVTDEPVTIKKNKPQAINARLTRYKKRLESVANNSRNNPIALKAQTFIKDPNPDYERLSKLVTEILQNRPPKSKQLKALNNKQKEDLLENVICFWLDRHVFNGKEMSEIERLNELIDKVEKIKIRPGKIFNYWDFSEVKHYEPELDEGAFRKIFNE